jgi:hypothetical protein
VFVFAKVSPAWTGPEPSVFVILERVQEELAYLKVKMTMHFLVAFLQSLSDKVAHKRSLVQKNGCKCASDDDSFEHN